MQHRLSAGFRVFAYLFGVGLLCLASSCTTRPTIDWSTRLGVYTYDQAVMDYGPPEKMAELSDKSLVAEWLTRRGAYRVDTFGYGYYGGPYYRPYGHYGYYPGYAMGPHDVSRTPDQFLRLIFNPEGQLKGFNQFSK